jgi:hypothetical protein
VSTPEIILLCSNLLVSGLIIVEMAARRRARK